MAINLSGKADASIVSAAKAAGDALKGPDYSKTFQGMATAYAGAMDKMGAGLAEVAKVGTMAAGALVKDLKTAKGELGEGLYSKVMGDLKGLIKDRLDIFKMPDGSEEKAEAKEEFKRNKKIRFQEFRDLRDGTLANNLNIETGNINEEYLREHPEYSMMLQANALYGEPIKEGPFAGVKVDYVRDAEGNLQLQYTGPDGKPVVGLKDDGSPIYKGDEVKAPTGVEDKTQILRKTKTNQKIRAYLPLEEGGLDRLANEGYTSTGKYTMPPFKEKDVFSGSYTHLDESSKTNLLINSRRNVSDIGTRFNSAANGFIISPFSNTTEKKRLRTDSIAFIGLRKG